MVQEIGKEKIMIGVPVFRRAPFTFETMGVPVANGKFKKNDEIVNFVVNVDALGRGIQFIIGGKHYSLNVKEIAICLMNKVIANEDFFDYQFDREERNILMKYMAYNQKHGTGIPDMKTAVKDLLHFVWDDLDLKNLIEEDKKNGEKESKKG